MATKAYILIETSVGKSREVAETLRKIAGMRTVDPVTGPYDIVAVVEADDLNSIGHLITGQVHTIGGIVRTVTCLSLNS